MAMFLKDIMMPQVNAPKIDFANPRTTVDTTYDEYSKRELGNALNKRSQLNKESDTQLNADREIADNLVDLTTQLDASRKVLMNSAATPEERQNAKLQEVNLLAQIKSLNPQGLPLSQLRQSIKKRESDYDIAGMIDENRALSNTAPKGELTQEAKEAFARFTKAKNDLTVLKLGGAVETDPKIAALMDEMTNASTDYFNATGKQLNATSYGSLAMGANNLVTAKQKRLDLAGSKDKVRQAVLDDVGNVLKDFVTSNDKELKAIPELANFVAIFEDFMNIPMSKVSPSAYATLGKALNKLIEPTAAIMSDDMKMLAKYGGENNSMFTELLRTVQSLISIVPKFNSGNVSDVASEVTVGALDFIVQTGGKIFNKTANRPATQQEEQAVKAKAPRVVSDAKNTSRAVQDADFIGQWKNIVDTGKKLVVRAKDRIEVSKKAAADLASQSKSVAQFRNVNALAQSEGTTVEQLLATPEGQTAFQAEISSKLPAILNNLPYAGKNLAGEWQTAIQSAQSEGNSQDEVKKQFEDEKANKKKTKKEYEYIVNNGKKYRKIKGTFAWELDE